MKPLKYIAIGAAVLCAAGQPTFAEDQSEGVQNKEKTSDQQKSLSPTGSESTDTKDADNTGKNVRDRSDSALTPGDQGKSPQDVQTTQKIRRAITSDDQLSTTAKNVKIITDNGKVTLRGPVNSQQEKQAIEDAARKAGVNNIDNQLEIKTKNH